MFVSLVHSVISFKYLFDSFFPFNIFNWYIHCFIWQFRNWIIVSVVEYLWLFVLGCHEFNIIYLFHFDVFTVVPVAVANLVIVGVLLFFVVTVVLLNFSCFRPLFLMHAGIILFLLIIIILVHVSLYVLLLFIHLFYM